MFNSNSTSSKSFKDISMLKKIFVYGLFTFGAIITLFALINSFIQNLPDNPIGGRSDYFYRLGFFFLAKVRIGSIIITHLGVIGPSCIVSAGVAAWMFTEEKLLWKVLFITGVSFIISGILFYICSLVVIQIYEFRF